MANLKNYPDAGAVQRTGPMPAVIETAGRHAGQAVDSSGGASWLHGSWTMNAFVAIVLVVWLAVVILLGAQGAFVSPLGTPPIPIAIGVAAPLIVFFVAFWLSGAFRRFVTNADIRLVAALEAWRFAGFGFISLYAYGVLPGDLRGPQGWAIWRLASRRRGLCSLWFAGPASWPAGSS